MALAIAAGFVAFDFAARSVADETSSMAAFLSRDDPRLDGWDTELLQADAQKQLDRIARSLINPTSAQLGDVVADNFWCETLRPELDVVFQEGPMVVRRRTLDDATSKKFRGQEGLSLALRPLAECISESTRQRRAKFKLFGIQSEDMTFQTRQFFTLAGQSPEGRVEVHSTWVCRWNRRKAGAPRLQSIQIEDHEETLIRGIRQAPFVDCTEEVLGGNACYARQFAQGLDYWNSRVLRVDTDGMHGLAVGDANADGLDDVYVCQIAPLPNRLFLQQRDGSALDVSAEAGVDWLEPTHSALFIDMDNDGDQDVLIGTTSALLVMENDGAAKFTVRRKMPGARDAYSLSAADYDQDGDLDVFACVYLAKARRRQILAVPVPFHDARNGGRNVLLRNDDSFRLTDVTHEVGLEAEASRRSFAASWEDFDNDGDVDLYVANDYGRNNLFRNEGGRFIDVARSARVEDQSFGMSVSWSDFNHDGWMDLYVSNMFSAAGNRIVYQQRFKSKESPEVRQKFQYMARGNSLFQNLGNGPFRDVSSSAAIMMGQWSWGSKFVDFNNDGYDDLIVANGYLTRSNPDDL